MFGYALAGDCQTGRAGAGVHYGTTRQAHDHKYRADVDPGAHSCLIVYSGMSIWLRTQAQNTVATANPTRYGFMIGVPVYGMQDLVHVALKTDWV